jgi:hypothetical protein
LLILSAALSVLTFIEGGVTMVSEIIVALIGGLVTLSGVLIANSKAQAVTDARLDELTREVREHNHFARRVPVLEEQIKVANHRIDNLERKGD